MKSRVKKFTKYFLVFIAVIIGLLTLWFLLKPLRVAKAGEYLNSKNLIDYQKAAVLTPLSPLVHLKIGEVYESQGRLEEAEKEFKKIGWICQNFTWKNKDLKGCSEYKEGYFNLKKIKAQKALEEGDLNEAEAALAAALELDSSDPEVGFYLGIILTAQGEYELASENLKGKIESLELENQREILLSALKKTDSQIPNPYSLVLAGTAFLKMDYQNLAIFSFKKALELEPDYRDALVYLGEVYLIKNEPEKALESLEKATKIDPVYPETFYLLSKTYQKLKKPDESQEALEKARTLGWKE